MERLVFDIGCYSGEWLKANYNEDTYFVGVDANPEGCKKARENFKDKDNVHIFNILISDVIGVCDFYILKNAPGSTASLDLIHRSRFSKDYKWEDPVKVESTTLDTLINVFGSPDYIKIDVDGWELNVLKGLTKKVGMIAFEWIEEFKDKAIDCVQYLGGLGYTDFNWIHGTDDYKFVPKKWMSFNNFMNLIKKELNPERQEGWGMVYAK